MPKQEPTTSNFLIQIPFVGSPTARTSDSSAGSETDEILARLDSCGELVHSELEAYRNSLPSDAVEASQACLLSIVIPVYNEENTIARVISRVTSLPLNTELVIVDDCSTDGTRDLLKKLEGLSSVKLILKEQNAGKGAALRTGFEHATGDFVVIQDADLEYDPSDIPRLIQPLLKGDADVVYGSRFIGDDQQDESWIHRAGNAMLTGASNLFSGLSLTDMETCYKAFNREVLEGLQIAQDRFGIEPELTAKLARRGYRFVEVPISYNSRGYSEGKKIGIRDLFNAIYCIGRYGITD